MRLIDADVLKEKFLDMGCLDDKPCYGAEILDRMPTICDIDAIRQEIEKVFCISVITNELRTPMEVKAEILQIIDKYKAESEDKE